MSWAIEPSILGLPPRQSFLDGEVDLDGEDDSTSRKNPLSPVSVGHFTFCDDDDPSADNIDLGTLGGPTVNSSVSIFRISNTARVVPSDKSPVDGRTSGYEEVRLSICDLS